MGDDPVAQQAGRLGRWPGGTKLDQPEQHRPVAGQHEEPRRMLGQHRQPAAQYVGEAGDVHPRRVAPAPMAHAMRKARAQPGVTRLAIQEPGHEAPQGDRDQEGLQGVGARLLRHGDGRWIHREQQRGHDRGAGREQPARGQIGEAGGPGYGDGRQCTHRRFALPQPQPEGKNDIIEGRMRVLRGPFEHAAQAAQGGEKAGRFIVPKRLGTDPKQAEAERKRDDQDWPDAR